MSCSPIKDSYLFLKGLVFAGIADLARPADKLSPSQSTALAATGETIGQLFHIFYSVKNTANIDSYTCLEKITFFNYYSGYQ